MQREGWGAQWARSTAFLFWLVLLLSFSILSQSHHPTPTPPTQAIPVSVTAVVTAWRLNPEGRDLLAHTGNRGPKSTWRIPVAFVPSVLFLLGVEGRHSCRNAQQSKYTKDRLSRPRVRRTIPVSWKVVQSLQRAERLRKKPHIRVFDS